MMSMLRYSVDNAIVGRTIARRMTAMRQLPQGSDGAATLGERTTAAGSTTACFTGGE